MIVVYWRQAIIDLATNLPTSWQAHSAEFQENKLQAALAQCEGLRAARAAGAYITHVCIQSELMDSVGQAGVAEPDHDYNWHKRRPDPLEPVGREPFMCKKD
jgi:hypothetical protein